MCAGYVYLLQNILILLALTSCFGTRELNGPALDFSKHSIVQPSVHHGRTKRELSSTRDTNGAHHSEVQVSVPVEGEQWVLELRLNEDLVTEGHTLQYQQGRRTVQHIPTREELDLCHYSGRVRGKPQSWVAVSTCHGVRGVIFDGIKMRYIEPAQGAEIKSLHYLYDHKDLKTERSQRPSGHFARHSLMEPGGEVINNTIYDDNLSSRLRRAQREIQKRRYKRDAEEPQVREPYNANESSRYVELVLVADHSEYLANGRNLRAIHSQFIQLANIVNSMYAPLNIFIALVGVEVWSEHDEIQITEDGDRALAEFLKYKQKLAYRIPHDNAHLITHTRFYNEQVGKALPYTMCNWKSSGGVVVNYTDVIGLEAGTLAHEMGHNFGMAQHDENCIISECPDKKCIMSYESTSLIPIHWSSCSKKALQESFEKGQDYCLHNKPKRLFGSPTCGNGFVEPGEQCDCGITAGGGTNPCHACCHPDTCMLRGNATCGAGACCDFTTCSVKSAGVLCRAAERECDLPEYCSGHSEYCPADVYKMDSTPCGVGDNQAYCVRGACNSHADHCRLLWGASGTNHDECYVKNTEGILNGNCGYDPISRRYIACAPSDTRCGLLQCRTQEYRLHHAIGDGVDTPVWAYARNNQREDCYIANFNVEPSNADFGLVPDGAKCGHEQMCLKQRCVHVEDVREEISRRVHSACPSHCSGHGVCNSNGHCHCDAGFAPPRCAYQGLGGSDDSGPATKLSRASSNFIPKPNYGLSSSIPNNKPNYDFGNPRPNNKPNYESGSSKPNNMPNYDSGRSKPINKPNYDSARSGPNNKPNYYSGSSRPNNKPNYDTGSSKLNIKPNYDSARSRPNNKPNYDSGSSRPNNKPNYDTGSSRPNDKPNFDSGSSRPNNNPNYYTGRSRPNNEPNYDSGSSRPNNKPNYDTGRSRPNNKPKYDTSRSRPNNNPNYDSGSSRPNNKPNYDSGSSRPNNEPNYDSGSSRPNNKPNYDSGSSRHNNKPNYYSGGSRPNNKPKYDTGRSRPNKKPNYDSGSSRPNHKPNYDSGSSRPNNKPNYDTGRSRPNNKPNYDSGSSRPNHKPNYDSGSSRPDKPNYNSGSLRRDYVPSDGSGDSGFATKLNNSSVDTKYTTDPLVTRNIKIALYVIFLGIVPLIILLLLVYYTRHNALWKQPMKLYANNVACCIKKLPKYANKMKTITKGIGSDIGDKDETDKNFAQLSNDSKLNKPVTNTIDSNQIYSNDVRMKPLVALRKPALKLVKPKLNISKDDIQILTNDMASKPDNPISKIDNDENTFVSNGVTLKAINPMTVNDNNNIQVAFNNIKLNHTNMNPKIDNGDIKSQINHVKLKPVPTTGNDASARGVEKVPIKSMLNVNKNHIQTEISNVKLKPIKLSPKVNNDIQTKITGVNLKPVQPLVTSKPKPLVTPKPELLNLK